MIVSFTIPAIAEYKEKWYVYILECGDKTFYTGITNDIQNRINKHNSGKGAKYTRARLPVKLKYFEEVRNKSVASKREYEIKQLTRKQKEKLIYLFDAA